MAERGVCIRRMHGCSRPIGRGGWRPYVQPVDGLILGGFQEEAGELEVEEDIKRTFVARG